ncbi:hypothetical protein B296_00015799 [Ensete ventricosum]|uniref:Uncharacterized protein n=1 Tax=Ensete ventricosum TaxID=4639 RepID=A0A427AJB8_ENSVE|nr:hypothetical protein B296_00015799 [Ensete ventricosum]
MRGYKSSRRMRVAGSNGSDDAWIPSLLPLLRLRQDWREVTVQHVAKLRRTHHSGRDCGGHFGKRPVPGEAGGSTSPDTPFAVTGCGPTSGVR